MLQFTPKDSLQEYYDIQDLAPGTRLKDKSGCDFIIVYDENNKRNIAVYIDRKNIYYYHESYDSYKFPKPSSNDNNLTFNDVAVNDIVASKPRGFETTYEQYFLIGKDSRNHTKIAIYIGDNDNNDSLFDVYTSTISFNRIVGSLKRM